jgi:hypothetical protein
MALHPDSAAGASAAKSFLQGSAFQVPALEHSENPLADRAAAASAIAVRGKAIQILCDQQRERALPDSRRTGKNHRMGESVLPDCALQYFYCARIADETVKACRDFHVNRFKIED